MRPGGGIVLTDQTIRGPLGRGPLLGGTMPYNFQMNFARDRRLRRRQCRSGRSRDTNRSMADPEGGHGWQAPSGQFPARNPGQALDHRNCKSSQIGTITRTEHDPSHCARDVRSRGPPARWTSEPRGSLGCAVGRLQTNHPNRTSVVDPRPQGFRRRQCQFVYLIVTTVSLMFSAMASNAGFHGPTYFPCCTDALDVRPAGTSIPGTAIAVSRRL